MIKKSLEIKIWSLKKREMKWFREVDRQHFRRKKIIHGTLKAERLGQPYSKKKGSKRRRVS
jgi:hypothetical protein